MESRRWRHNSKHNYR